jgi:hypothetical protein
MRRTTALKTLALALPMALAMNGCILIPEIEDRTVELAIGASTSAEFHSAGATTSLSDTKTVDIKLDVNLSDILADNGIDATDVKDVKLAGLSYKIVVPQTGQSISGGTLVARRGAGADTTIASGVTADASSATGFITIPLNADGVKFINNLLYDLLREAQGGPAATNTVITYTVTGTSAVAPDFTWAFKLDVSVVGSFKTTVVN